MWYCNFYLVRVNENAVILRAHARLRTIDNFIEPILANVLVAIDSIDVRNSCYQSRVHFFDFTVPGIQFSVYIFLRDFLYKFTKIVDKDGLHFSIGARKNEILNLIHVGKNVVCTNCILIVRINSSIGIANLKHYADTENREANSNLSTVLKTATKEFEIPRSKQFLPHQQRMLR